MAKKSDLLELLRSQLELPPAPEEFAADPQGSNLHVRAQKTLAGGLVATICVIFPMPRSILFNSIFNF